MKMKRRALALLLSMVMVLTFMPALAFAGDDEAAAEGAPAAELTEAPELNEAAQASYDAGDWSIWVNTTTWLHPKYGDSIYGGAEMDDDSIDLEFRWLRGGSALTEWSDFEYDPEYGEYYGGYHANPGETGTYTFCVREKNNPTSEKSLNAIVYDYPSQGGVYFYPIYDNYGNLTNQACVEEIDTETLKGDISIPSVVAFGDGVTRTVTECWVFAPYASSISIPATVTTVYRWLGFNNDDNLIPGFVIYGTYGTEAQVHANKYGIAFRDLAAEAEAARQGTYVAGLPKVKIAKPAAAKKSVTVKWKKLDKKQLKKGVTNIEVWVCPNKAFGAGDTIIKFAGKKKASLKVKGLKKGTYFVKVRAIKNVGGVKQYTAWSKVKKVKVKK